MNFEKTSDSSFSTSKKDSYDVIIIGGGQTGLAMAQYVRQLKDKYGEPLSFCIIDENENAGASWQKRWDSLKLFSPASFSNLPGYTWADFRRKHKDKSNNPKDDEYPSKQNMIDYLTDYANILREFEIELKYGIKVEKLSRIDPPAPRQRKKVFRASQIRTALDQKNENSTLIDDVSGFNAVAAAPKIEDVVTSERLMQGTSAGTVFHRMFRLDCQSKSGNKCRFRARQVVLATGAYSVPRLPKELCNQLDENSIPWLHVYNYRNFKQSFIPMVEKRRNFLQSNVGVKNQAENIVFNENDAENRNNSNEMLNLVVIGAGASGVQITNEIIQELKKKNEKSATIDNIIPILVGRDTGSLPRKVMGKDSYWWLYKSGLLTMDKGSFVGSRALTASVGGDPIVGKLLPQLIQNGVTHVSARVVGIDLKNQLLRLESVAPDHALLSLNENCDKLPRISSAYEGAKDDLNVLIDRSTINIKQNDNQDQTESDEDDNDKDKYNNDSTQYDSGMLTRVKCTNGGWLHADVVLFACGYEQQENLFPFVNGLFLQSNDDEDRRERWMKHDRGVCIDVPGLYVLGLPWLQRADSGLIHGIARDAKHLSHCIRALHREVQGGGKSHSYRELSLLSTPQKSKNTRVKYDDDAYFQY